MDCTCVVLYQCKTLIWIMKYLEVIIFFLNSIDVSVLNNTTWLLKLCVETQILVWFCNFAAKWQSGIVHFWIQRWVVVERNEFRCHKINMWTWNFGELLYSVFFNCLNLSLQVQGAFTYKTLNYLLRPCENLNFLHKATFITCFICNAVAQMKWKLLCLVYLFLQ